MTYITMSMDAKKSRICRIIIIVATVALAGWFAAMADATLVVISVAVCALLFYLCKTNTVEVVDERDERVGEKASKAAMLTFAAISALAGVLLIAVRNEHPEYTNVGFALAFSACALMILYSVLYGYYNRRYGYEPDDEE